MRVLLAYADEILFRQHGRGAMRADSGVDHDSESSVTVAFVCAEEGDVKEDAVEIANYLKNHKQKHSSETVVLFPFAHLSPFATNDLSLVRTMLGVISANLQALSVSCVVRPPAGQDLFFAKLILFDGNASTHLRCSKNSLKQELKSLMTIFGKNRVISIMEEIEP